MMRPFPRRRRGPRRDTPPATRTTILGLIVVGVMAITGFLLLRVYNGVPGVPYKTAYVSVPNVGNLLNHDAVRVGGYRVGQVLALDVGDDGRPRIELQLLPGTKLPDDTKVAIRASGLLGARYVALTPGSSRELLADGETIKGGEDSYAYGLPETVAVFDEEARGGLQKTVSGLSEGLLGNGAPLNAAINNLRTPAGDFRDVARTVLAREGAAARLVPSLASAVAPLDKTRGSTRPMLQATNDTFEPVVAEGKALRDTLSAAPATLIAAENGLRRGRRVLGSVRGLSVEAEKTLPPAPAALRQLTGLLREGQAPLRRAAPTVRDLLPAAAREARAALIATEPVVPRVKSGVDTARPLLDVVGRYRCDVINSGQTIRSMTGFGQPGRSVNGPAMAFRLQAVPAGVGQVLGIGDNSVTKRAAYEEPCRYVSRSYPQLIPGSEPKEDGR